jgi:cytochrome c peroxidase
VFLCWKSPSPPPRRLHETRGLALFNDPAKGNCAHCHISARGADGTPPQFTDYGLAALGVPRNTQIPANGDPSFYDHVGAWQEGAMLSARRAINLMDKHRRAQHA